MTCAIVLHFDQPFQSVDDEIGLTKAAEIRMTSHNPTNDIIVLVVRGFESIPEAAISKLAELRYRVINAEDLLEKVRSTYRFAREPRIWRNQPFHEICFLRWLVLEEFFGDTPVLAMDSDIVWRVDPFPLYDTWKQGNSFLCFQSCCLAFVKDRIWYEVYKSGLERLEADANFGREFSRSHFTGIYHDQALFQYLRGRGELGDDSANFLGHGFAEQFFLSANPIGIGPATGKSPLSFEQGNSTEIVDGRIVPFWHMQNTFSRYLFLARLLPALTGQKGIRIPYERPTPGGSDLTLRVLNNFHLLLKKGQIKFHHNGYEQLGPLAKRAGQYEEFFNGELAREVFCEEAWWKRGVWRARQT